MTVWYSAPTAIRLLMKEGTDIIRRHDLSCLRHLASVGEPLNAEAVVWSQDAFGKPFHDTFWQTETGCIVITNFPGMKIKSGSMGKPFPGITAAVLNTKTYESVTEPGIAGLIALRPGWPSQIRGYWKNESGYQAKFKNGWYLCGDRASIDSDGYYWFMGRDDDVINTGGHLVGPFEIESALLEHHAVSESAAVAKPDPVNMEVVKAFVTLKPGYEPGPDLELEIMNHIRKRLSPLAMPQEIEFVDSLPKTRSGKIVRRILRCKEFNEPVDDISTVMDANGGFFEACLNEQDVMIADRLVHASIVDGVRLCKAMQDTYKHSDMGHLEEKLQEYMDKRSRMIITDGVFSMDGDIAKLDEIVELGEKYDAMVFVDDSHSTGFIGRTGRGTHEHFGVVGKIDVITTTLGKALGGASGGCVSGRRELVEMCRQRARPYLFSNSVAPVIVAGALKVMDLITSSTERRDKLEWNTTYWRGLLKDAGFDVKKGESPIVPVMLYDAKLAQEFACDLFHEGVYAVGFFFPVVPKGQARIRTQLSAAHDKRHLDFAIEAFKKGGEKHGVLGLGQKELVARAGV